MNERFWFSDTDTSDSLNTFMREAVENSGGGNPYHDPHNGQFTTGGGSVSGGTGALTKGKSTSSGSQREFVDQLSSRGVGDISISVAESVIKDGHGKAILETLDNIPDVSRSMIAKNPKKLSLNYTNYPHIARATRRYTRGMYNPKTNKITLFYDAKNPRLTTAKRVKTTLTHELMHVADHSGGVFSSKTSPYFREYAKVSHLTPSKRAPFVDSLTHAVKNVHEFYANTMTSYLTNNPTSNSKQFKTEMVPIIKHHIEEYSQ